MMNNKQLFSVLPDAKITGQLRRSIGLLTDDSRQVVPGSCYIAVRGTQFDGHSVIPRAIADGAVAIVAETPCPPKAEAKGIYWVQVENTREACGRLMSAWYGFPSQQMVMLGVTGTNGKTTISYLLHHIVRNTWHKAGLIGTILYDNGASRTTSHNTTPGSAELQRMLAEMVRNGCRAVSMEVSSHALEQHRTAGTNFRIGIFTNLTQDHLDYHGDMESYYQAKKKLFLNMAESGDSKAVAVINVDDTYGRRLAEEMRPLMKVRTFGESLDADYRIVPRLITLKGSRYELIHHNRTYLVRIPLIGAFNISNSAAALVGAAAAGVNLRDAISSLAAAPQVPGRMELVSSGGHVQCFVDYAHTPDALENVCSTMRELCRQGKLIVVFGCGGNRDRTKRPLMGAAAAKYADICLVTSDNPRNEDPVSIIDEIMPGIPAEKQHRITHRAEAIRTALDMARPGEVELIAGKGHEDYQIIGDKTIHFSDAEEVRQYRLMREEGIAREKAAEKAAENHFRR